MARDTLQKAGMNTVRDDSLPVADAIYTYTGIFRKYGNPEFKAALGGGKPYNLLVEIARNLTGQRRISARVLFFVLGIDFAGWEAQRLGLNTFEKLEEIRQVFLAAMGVNGVILCPLFLTPPPKHGWTWRLRQNPALTLLFNAMGFPAVVLPLRYNEQSLPLAVQIVARPGEDEVALAVAAELERVHGGWKMAKDTP
jgi:fatty acid amide hydrolase 2